MLKIQEFIFAHENWRELLAAALVGNELHKAVLTQTEDKYYKSYFGGSHYLKNTLGEE